MLFRILIIRQQTYDADTKLSYITLCCVGVMLYKRSTTQKLNEEIFFTPQIILVLKSFDLYGNSHITVTIQIVSHVLGNDVNINLNRFSNQRFLFTAYTNSCVNPVLYAFLSENFRKAFRKVRQILFYLLALIFHVF